MKKVLAIVIALLIGVFCFLYFVSYEDGYWAGKVLSVSKKGVLFKTYEGRISMESFGALKNTSPIAEVRDFSVESSNDQVLKDLEQVALTGERVNLKFKRMFVRFFWRGDTKYFVTEVERVGTTQTPATPQTP
ncbi:MAG: hypothetical protein JNJ75_00290 [Cyclobacteriaceae bacterium]|nr:hypothetical protein [Cyclobacteriaceae bacterium]